MTKKLALKKIFRNGAAVDRQKNIFVESTVGVNRPRDHFLADAALPGNENRRRSRRDFFYQVGDLLHRLAAPERPFGTEASVDLAPQQLILPGELAVIHQVLHFAQHIFKNKRLEQIILGAETDRFNRGIDGRMRGHQYHQGLRRDVADVPQHGDAVRAGHGEIGEHQVEIVLVDERYARFTIGCSMNVKALAF